MNIFFLRKDPRQAAIDQCDKHAVKMPLESAQMLCTAYRRWCDPLPEKLETQLYKKAYINHPMTVWVGDSTQHNEWLYITIEALLVDYKKRYDREHASSRLVPFLDEFPEDMPNAGWTDPPQCMPDEFKSSDFIEAYRQYYVSKAETAFEMRWTERDVPEWFKSDNLEFLDLCENTRLTPSALLS